MITPEFLFTSLIVVLIPGTGVVFTVATGLGQGRKASFYAALGCTAGIVPHLLATVLGLAALMHAHALRRHVIGAPRLQAWLRRGFAATFAGLGIHLALAER